MRQAMRSVGPYVVEKFCEVVKLRNQLARLAGFEVRRTGGFDPPHMCSADSRP
jgi:hypothetical protein